MLSPRGALNLTAAMAIVIVAVILRVPRLADRPLHGDEAVNTVKFQQLRENGEYRYDPSEFHGPVLPYATLPILAVSGADKFCDTRESHYRIVTVLFGAALVALTLGAGPAIGWPAALVAALWTAISTAMVFYSRYYIHEMPLVLFTLAAILCGWRWCMRPSLSWAAACGAMLALMHATKETAVLAWVAMGVALIGAAALRAAKRDQAVSAHYPDRPLMLHGSVIAFAAFIVTYVVLFSSFFTHWPGVLDGVRTFFLYADRGTGGEPLHVHPWHFYFERLIFYRAVPRAPWFSEALIVMLAVAGALAAAAGRGIDDRFLPFARFLAIYTVMLTAIYTVIPYKTPWCVLSFLHGMILLAGIGAVAVVRVAPRVWAKTLIVIVLATAAGHLAWQTGQANLTRLQSHRVNPWVYAHPIAGIREIPARVDELAAAAAAAGLPMKVLLITGDENLWPLPFYLRCVEWSGFTGQLDAPVVIASTHISRAVRERLGDDYVGPHHYGVRPQVIVAMFVRRDLWDQFMAAR